MPEFDLRPPYPLELAGRPYPPGYTPPIFPQFNGRRGNAKEHVVRFLDALASYGVDESLRLREFSKSLTDLAYTWYTMLTPDSIRSWEEMVRAFSGKFFCIEERMSLVSLSRTRQKDGEELVDYVRRFRERAMECYEPITERRLMDMCISGMSNTYQPYLINHQFEGFSRLLEASRKIGETVARPSRSTWRNDRERKHSNPMSSRSVERRRRWKPWR